MKEINVEYDSGVYVLEIFLHKPKKLEIGALGNQTFPPGYYYYCGSAQKDLKARMKRHYKKRKNYHWHVDFLLREGHIQNHYTWPLDKSGECKLRRYLKDELNGKEIVHGFGSSDCDCDSHLIYFEAPLEKSQLIEVEFSNSKE
jgi:Uri superfamily endonuclease